ncbi:hypothetical protein [Lederbergia citrea]|uniref:Uncharacterized protein n=1 Tax=Lederbergia citrea TaxID=2833581 RepID=A0A942Z2V2_9BACI|nr:hypothetical protein [Lederbergia citrea]MBS4221864.1 hypothetical protein [Lederbergia citrea]
MTVEEKLHLLGIPLSHIQFLKETNLKLSPDGYFPKKDLNKLIIPVSKIVGLDLKGEPGYSWWDHLTRKRGDLTRLAFLVRRLAQLGLEGYKATYMMEEYVQDINLLYFPEIDFYIGSNGLHRITMAKLTNVEYLISDVTIMERTNKFLNNSLMEK